jgi:hypothetical protein
MRKGCLKNANWNLISAATDERVANPSVRKRRRGVHGVVGCLSEDMNPYSDHCGIHGAYQEHMAKSDKSTRQKVAEIMCIAMDEAAGDEPVSLVFYSRVGRLVE